MIFEHLLYWLNVNVVVTTQACNIHAVVWRKYKALNNSALSRDWKHFKIKIINIFIIIKCFC